MNDENPAPSQPDSSPKNTPEVQRAEPANPAPATQPQANTELQEVKRQLTGYEQVTLRWTMVIVGINLLTCIFIFLQWREMKSGSTGTHMLAEAAQTQSGKMSNMSDAADKIRQAAENMVIQDKRIADNAQMALDASNKQSKSALDASIAASRDDQRAWVAETAVGCDDPEIGKVVKAFANWNNSGKTFAKKVVPRVHLIFVPTPITDEKALIKLASLARVNVGSIGVLAPNGQYKTPIETAQPVNESDKGRISGDWYTYIWGEMTYDDIFKQTHTTVFCSSRKGGSGDFLQCPFHNDAN